VEQSLRLEAERDAVPRARRFVQQLLSGSAAAGLTDDVELVVTELVTNALIHAEPPLQVAVEVHGDVVRVEVADGSRLAPLRSVAAEDAMTGRGLSLVEALSAGWGVEPRGSGKVVWARLTIDTEPGRVEAGADVDVDIDDVLAQWPDLADTAGPIPGVRRHTATIGGVPTELLLAAKAHVDNLVREFTLAEAGAVAGQTAMMSPHLRELISRVTQGFAEARLSIKRQALAAAAEGHDRTTLVLNLPLEAAEAGRAYLAALDEADAYARAARLLTLESRPEHRALRRWYVSALADQLQAAARGEAAGPSRSFEHFLLEEVAAISAAQRSLHRTERLQSVTAALAGAASATDVAATVVAEVVAALGASGGGLLVPDANDHLDVPGAVGYEDELIDRLRRERQDANLPAAVVMRTRLPVWLESRQERDARFPELTGLEPNTVSMCAVPLIVSGHMLGALRFSFATARLFDMDERAFVEAIAAQAAQALERGRLSAAERAARADAEALAARLEVLQRVTEALAAAKTTGDVAEVIARQSAQTLGASLSALCIAEDQFTLAVVGMHGGRPETRARWTSFPIEANLPASEAFRTGKAVLVSGKQELEQRFPELAGLTDADHALVCLPISTADQRIGVLALSFDATHHPVDGDELEVVTTMAHQCAVALERTELLAAERAARERSTVVAEAAIGLAASTDSEAVARSLADILVPTLADWAVVCRISDDTVEVAAAAHRDPDRSAHLLQLQREHPLDRSATGGVGEVLRTRRSIRYSRMPGEIRSRTIRSVEDSELARDIEPHSGIAVPMTVGDRMLGAVALARVQGEAFSEHDLRLAELIATYAAVAIQRAESRTAD
jgi:GAF domain-containing protein/anti-sigma regulatory factor (Ser/Thr protein kinase)